MTDQPRAKANVDMVQEQQQTDDAHLNSGSNELRMTFQSFEQGKENNGHDWCPDQLVSCSLDEHSRCRLWLVWIDHPVQKFVPGVPYGAVDEQPIGAQPEHPQRAERLA